MPEDAHSDRIIRVEFRLLGSLEVAVNNETFDFGSARQRIILAMLLLQANQVVPLAQLVDAVWDGKPPATAESQVQTLCRTEIGSGR
jgi:DNA-binding SARP family transcriptional activator